MNSFQHLMLVLLTSSLAAVNVRPARAAQPNIIVILADDAGYADFGFQGGGIRGDFAALTPNIDSLARGGLRFSDAYVLGPVCSPSRAALLTGRQPQRFGMEQNIQREPNAGLPVTEKTVANTMKALGYRTYALGKWHLGEDLPEHHPNRRGFDEFFGFLSGARTYYQLTGLGNASRLQRNGVFVTESPDQYLTDVLGKEAAAYLSAHVARYPAQPFFMYLAFNGVHTPLEATSARLADPRIQGIPSENRRTLAAMTIALDDGAQRPVDAPGAHLPDGHHGRNRGSGDRPLSAQRSLALRPRRLAPDSGVAGTAQPDARGGPSRQTRPAPSRTARGANCSSQCGLSGHCPRACLQVAPSALLSARPRVQIDV